MNRFDYVRAASVAEAVEAVGAPGATLLAAGTNLLDLMKGGVSRPERLVDITRVPGLDRVDSLPDGSLRIGALVRNSDLAHDAGFATRYPAVAEALLSGASGQLRNAATAAGNIMQRTRCPYFYDVAAACNKRDPGTGCDAQGGETRLHAIFGWSDHCVATHPSDFCVPLVALDAVVEIEGRSGRREVPLETFHRLPGDEPERETVLEPGELTVAVRLPPEAAGFAAHTGSFGSLAENRVDRGLAIFGEVFESFDRLETEAAKERQRGVANCGEHLRGMAGVGSRLIFTATDIANVMQLIFDAPVIAR